MEVPSDILAARAKLKEKVGAGITQIGGKGTARRKLKKVTKPSGGDDRKVQQLMKKSGATNLPDIEEVRMVKDDGSYMSFNKPKIQASPQSNTYMINGSYTEKSMDTLMEMFEELASKGVKFDHNQLNMLLQNMPEESKMKNMEVLKNMQKEDDEIPNVANFEEVDQD